MRVLVTGATGNIGKAAIELFLAEGWEVIATSRSGKGAVNFFGAPYYPLSLCLDIDIARFLESQAPFDLVIVAHGVQQPSQLGCADFIDVYHSVIDGNLTSAVYLTQQLIEQDKLNPNALIVYCSSIHATQPRKSRGPYAIAKAGLEALTKIVAVEGAGNWRAIALRLGQLEDDGKPATMKNIKFDDAQLEALKSRCLTNWVDVDNVAKLCLSLYGQTEMSGAVIQMDSGHSLNIY